MTVRIKQMVLHSTICLALMGCKSTKVPEIISGTPKESPKSISVSGVKLGMNTAEARKACEGDDFTDETGTFTEKELEKRYWSFHGKNSALFQISFQRGAVVEVSGRTLVVGNDVFGPRAYVQSISEVLKEKPIKFFEGPNESDGIKSPVEHLVFVKVGVIIRNQSNIDQARYTLYDVKVFPRKTLQRSSEQP